MMNNDIRKCINFMKLQKTCYLLMIAASIQFSHAQEYKKSDVHEFPFTDEYWEVENGDGSVGEIDATVHEEKASLRLTGTQKVYLKDKEYKNFAIEFYCKGSGPGLGFRAQNNENFEYLYLRVPLTNKRDALQYLPVYNGSLPWQLYNYPKYEGRATFPRKKVGTLPLSIESQLAKGKINEQLSNALEKTGIPFSAESEVIPSDGTSWFIFDPETKKALILKKQNNAIEVLDFRTWIHVKVEVIESKMSVFIEDMETPAFVIDNLKMAAKKGKISLISDGNEVYFSDFLLSEISPGNKIKSNSTGEKVSSNYLTKWSISEMFKKDSTKVLSQIDSLLGNKSKFKSVQADSDGLLNISRFYDDMTKTVALTCNLMSDSDRTVKLKFDYADHLTIVLDSKILFDKGMNFQAPANKGEEGRVFVDDESVELNMKKGKNQLIFILSADNRQKFNWGFIAKLESPKGIYVK